METVYVNITLMEKNATIMLISRCQRESDKMFLQQYLISCAVVGVFYVVCLL